VTAGPTWWTQKPMDLEKQGKKIAIPGMRVRYYLKLSSSPDYAHYDFRG